jgi:hypothetical protein
VRLSNVIAAIVSFLMSALCFSAPGPIKAYFAVRLFLALNAFACGTNVGVLIMQREEIRKEELQS